MPKLLADFLQEQQEPFALEVYLLERGYYFRATALNNAKRSACCGPKKRRQADVSNCSVFVRALLGRLLLHNNHKIKNRGRRHRKGIPTDNHGGAEEVEDDTNLSDSCSESEEEDIGRRRPPENGNLFSEEEADADNETKWRSIEHRDNHLSPVSVLEETESDEEDYNSKTTFQGECSTSVSEYKSNQPAAATEELEELVGSNSYDQYIINKRALQQTKQLVVDCVREVIEKHRRRDPKKLREQLKKILGADELWKLVCESVWEWSQNPVDETNVVHLLRCDLLGSAEEWSSDSEQQKEEISMEIGDAILEGIINEIFTG
ncbi:hypothetical protein Salat_1170800 [Sesamum alatum]|uniref:DUF4378 domain-containing protein n=1 Tax=Sesamum alatum TaxID=300844 RepID=A0AAE1YEC7_9LAMI|nr:hypothetical protein Salat_1170800 [Sesamum alatum]